MLFEIPNINVAMRIVIFPSFTAFIAVAMPSGVHLTISEQSVPNRFFIHRSQRFCSVTMTISCFHKALIFKAYQFTKTRVRKGEWKNFIFLHLFSIQVIDVNNLIIIAFLAKQRNP
jgi:hypothetical protein